MDCIFCKIITKEIPAHIRYEDNEFLAFDDINPQAKTHILLIPKKHITSINDIAAEDQEIIAKILYVAKKVANQSGLNSYRLVTNSGDDAGQIVSHLHFHILGGEPLGNIA